jgi:hypothetical protein
MFNAFNHPSFTLGTGTCPGRDSDGISGPQHSGLRDAGFVTVPEEQHFQWWSG